MAARAFTILVILVSVLGCSGGEKPVGYGGEVKKAPGASAPQSARKSNAPDVDN